MERADFFDTCRPLAARLGGMIVVSVALGVAGHAVGQSMSPRPIVSGIPVTSVRLADIDQDQRPEVLLLRSDGNASVVHLDAEGAVLSDSALDLGQATTLGVADFDASGAQDLFFGFGGGNSQSVFLNDGNGLLEAGTQNLVATEARALGIGDFDGDGDSDVIIANGLVGATPNTIWLNNGRALFTSGQELGLEVTADVEVATLITMGISIYGFRIQQRRMNFGITMALLISFRKGGSLSSVVRRLLPEILTEMVESISCWDYRAAEVSKCW
jgi:hypothetical protein